MVVRKTLEGGRRTGDVTALAAAFLALLCRSAWATGLALISLATRVLT